MHTYNPLTLPETIAKIVQKMPTEDLNDCIYINRIWYKEICYELYKRRKNFNTKYYDLLEKLDRYHRKLDINDNEIEPIYNNALTIFEELVKVERYMLNKNIVFSKRIRNTILTNLEDYNYGNSLDLYDFGEDTFEYIKYLETM
ncbi:6865_t:CDS:1 [Gigaspora margarita]|uniref:6865_t:CDS:1 n=1 Tax=Gigaspora margarita TaxID=4874 RepID=A0ABN7WUC0_GIGMA|nr:6865_t:CDS:1 [Gigaspora margarita]